MQKSIRYGSGSPISVIYEARSGLILFFSPEEKADNQADNSRQEIRQKCFLNQLMIDGLAHVQIHVFYYDFQDAAGSHKNTEQKKYA